MIPLDLDALAHLISEPKHGGFGTEAHSVGSA